MENFNRIWTGVIAMLLFTIIVTAFAIGLTGTRHWVITNLGGTPNEKIEDTQYIGPLNSATYIFVDRARPLSECLSAASALAPKFGYQLDRVDEKIVSMRHKPETKEEAYALFHCYEGNLTGLIQSYLVVIARDGSALRRRKILAHEFQMIFSQPEE
jgi:hypothetical protein